MVLEAQLQVTTGYSLLQSTLQIDSLVKQAKHLGYRYLAITDNRTVHGLIAFYQACKRENIQPIMGITIPIDIKGSSVPVLVLAKNNDGYQALLQLSTKIQHEDGLEMNDYQPFANNLHTILLADSIDSFLWNDTFAHFQVLPNTYIGISNALVADKEKLAAYPMEKVALADVRYLHKQDQMAYSCLRAIDQGVTWTEENTREVEGTFLPDPSVYTDQFQEWPEVIAATNRLASQCHVELSFEEKQLPQYPVSPQKTANEMVKELAVAVLPEKYHPVTDAVKQRLAHELEVIQSMGFSDYFLIVWDFVKYAKEHDILVGPGRGSAAGSLIAYLLGITDVDPIRYDLLFERFLNPERVTMPDIDIDFSDEKRDQVIDYVAHKYGTDHVAQIVTFGTFAARSLLRELFKVLVIPENDQSYILRLLPRDSSLPIAAMLKQSPELTNYVKQSAKLRQLFKVCNCLEGLPKHVSTHAAGVVISRDALTQHTATMPSQHDVPLTQFAMHELERVGLLKFDFLGLRNLTIIERMTKQIAFHYPKNDHLGDLSFSDKATFQLLQKGETNGIFQLESQGMQQTLQKLRPTEFEDIVAVNALYRPGPMDFIPTYVARKHRQEKIDYLHPDLAPILAKTYGVLVYQEQIMQIVHEMAGFTYGQADILRRAVSKKDKALLLGNKEAFIKGALGKGYTKEVAEEVFDWIVRFSDYGFNRSHAVAYSMITYQLAYFKANFSLVFYTEMLNMNRGNTDKLFIYVREARQKGLTILPPSVNHSLARTKVEQENIRLGLTTIKGIGYQAVQTMIEARDRQPFTSLFDFCLRVPLKKINRSIITTLILAGAFDVMQQNRATLIATLEEAVEQGELFKEFGLQGDFDMGLSLDIGYTARQEMPIMEKLMKEKEVLGFFVSQHPLAEERQVLRRRGYLSIQQVLQFPNKKIKLAGVVQDLKVIRTKKGEAMAFVTLSDELAEMDAVLFPVTFRQVNDWLEEDQFVFIEGRVETRNDKKQIIIDKLEPYQLEEEPSPQQIYIKVRQEEAISRLDELAKQYPGTAVVYLYHEQEQKLYKLSDEYNLDSRWPVIKQLKQFFGEDNVVLKTPLE
ncbi:DNA polymerase III subunit alpha [Gracilibacillus phocaeensis]|uniref:DNA polymerase III subunit alpha n=1 Tax=Gracilibacillus phocaeensis TaxID=2042304 RepID=UPI00102F68A5|nr:DNA polymerase III subunit alpha [Gracilibacillus phocaeensis]